MPLEGTFRPKGGMTGSALKKASMLAELGHHVQLVTFVYRIDQPAHQEYLVESGLLSPQVKMVNFFEDMDNFQSDESIEQQHISGITGKELAPARLVQTKSQGENWHFSHQGDLLYTEQIKRDGYPRIYRRYFDSDSSLVRLEVREMDDVLRRVYRYKPGTSQALSESYISRNGIAYLSISYRQDGSVIRVVDHTKAKGQINPDLPHLAALQTRWFQDLVGQMPEATLLVDSPSSFRVVQPAMALASRSILTLHGNTFVHPNDPSSEINDESRNLLQHIDKFECVVASTKLQCSDLRPLYPEQKFVAIPQLVPVPPLETFINIERDPNLLVYVGRLEAPKQLIELIDAMPRLFADFPHLRFDIFGEGSVRAELKEKIELLGLSTHIRLMGRTENSLIELAKANLSVLPTRFEGFGIAIAESMGVGTPVVSFDCRYGPSDMIDDKISGRLVPVQDFHAMVSALIDLFADQDLVDEMRPLAREKITNMCGKADNMEAWNRVVDSSNGS